MDNIIFILNIFLFVILFSVFINIMIRNSNLIFDINDVEYIIYKPAFPFELKDGDPYQIAMYHKESVLGENPYLNT